MTRLPPITNRNDVSIQYQDVFDRITESRGVVDGPFSVLLHSPQAADRIAHLGTYIRFQSTLSPANRELAIIVTSREFDCEFEWSAHEPLARAAGVSSITIDIVANQTDTASLSRIESSIVKYGRELFRNHRVSDETFNEARSVFGDEGITELTATMGYYGMLACTLNAFEIKPPTDSPLLPQISS